MISLIFHLKIKCNRLQYNYKVLRKGQFGMNKMKAWQGSYGVSNFTGIVSPAYYIFNFIKSVNSEFFHWAIRSKIYVSFFASASDGVRIGQWDLSKDRMKSIPFVIPSESEQQKIAEYLDDKTAKIDQAIMLEEKQIELLKEHKQILIQNAVTKGLNPQVKFKDSGVEWIGEVPEHWEILQIKYQLKNIDSRRIPLSAIEREQKQGNYRYYGASGVIDYIDNYIFDGAFVLVGEDGANLINRSTPLAFSAYGQFWVNNHAHILEPIDGLSDFWAAAIEIIDVFPLVSGAAQPKLTAEALNNLKIAFPPTYQERKEIQDFIIQQTAKIDHAIQLKQQQIDKLKEYKAVLINDVVTGKVKVA